MRAYKLMRVRADGTLGPLFINAVQRIPVGVWLPAETCHKSKGYAYRPGWHATYRPYAPHLVETGRQWYHVELEEVTEWRKPECQGGLWYTAMRMKVIGPVKRVKRRDAE